MKRNLLLGAVLNFIYNECISHVPIHGLRLGFLRLLNRRIHPTAKVLMHARLLHFWKLEIGARTVINQHCVLDCRAYTVRIAHDVDVAPYVRVWTLGHDPDSPTHAVRGGDVVIEDHVWLASGVTVLPNVHIGRGAVVAAASVIHKDVPERHIMAGNPGRFIRLRQNDLTYHLSYRPLLE